MERILDLISGNKTGQVEDVSIGECMRGSNHIYVGCIKVMKKAKDVI